MSDTIKTFESKTHPGLRVLLEYDAYPEAPDITTTITYNSASRYILGNNAVDFDEHSDISRKVLANDYVGMPVWAYVHGDSNIVAAFDNPFSCPWDSGRSGWAYISKEQALDLTGEKRLTRKVREQVYGIIRSEVSEFNDYVNGRVYAMCVLRGEEVLDSCCGIYGYEYAEQMCAEALASHEKALPMQNELFEEEK
jgi:hypothetical protein